MSYSLWDVEESNLPRSCAARLTPYAPWQRRRVQNPGGHAPDRPRGGSGHAAGYDNEMGMGRDRDLRYRVEAMPWTPTPVARARELRACREWDWASMGSPS